MFKSVYDVPANAAKELGSVKWSGQGVLDIRYKQGVEDGTSWFLYGEPPFDIEKIKEWMK